MTTILFYQTILPRNAAAVKAVFFITVAITVYRGGFAPLGWNSMKAQAGLYMLEKTFMMMPPEIISTMAEGSRGRSGFVSGRIIEQMVTLDDTKAAPFP